MPTGTAMNFDVSHRRSIDGVIAAVSVLVLSIVVMLVWWVVKNANAGLDDADRIDLTEIVRQWREAGKPTGEKLDAFMRGRRENLIPVNRKITVEGTQYGAQFAITKAKSHRKGILYITSDQVLIWVASSGQAKLETFSFETEANELPNRQKSPQLNP